MNLPRAQSPDAVLDMLDGAVTSIHSPDVIIIDHVRWTVRRGEFWIIAGLPASGKSDLLATAAGLMRPAAGVVSLFGRDIGQLNEEERLQEQLRVGMVFGYGGRLFSHLTVAENLALPLCYHQNCVAGASEQRVRTVLEMMDLVQVAQHLPVALNRNLRQRAALARALVLSPELLFMDNPLASIDPREALWWLEFLGGLLEGHPILEGRKATLIASTDDLQPWGGAARQFAVIDRGRFVPVGTRADLLKQDNPALRQLLPVAWLRE